MTPALQPVAPRTADAYTLTDVDQAVVDSLYHDVLHEWEASRFFALLSSTELCGLHSESEADYQLLALLALGTRDPAQVERIARTSDRYRDKWDTRRGPQQTYLTRSIRQALAGTDREYRKRHLPPPEGAATEAKAGARAVSYGVLRKDRSLFTPPVAVVPCLAWLGRLTLVAATEGLGKSTLFSAAVAAVTRGRPFLGAATTKGTVLWVLIEEHPNDLLARAERFDTATGDELQIIPFPTEDRLAILVAEVRRLRPVLVVIDTLHTFADVEEASQATDWTPLLKTLRDLAAETEAAILMSAQAVKSTGDYADSRAIGHLVDVVLTMRKHGETNERILERKKARWYLPEKLGVVLVGDTYERTSPTADRTTVDEVQGLCDLMSDRPWTKAELAAKLGASDSTVKRRLHAAEVVGRVVRVGRVGKAARWHVVPSAGGGSLGQPP